MVSKTDVKRSMLGLVRKIVLGIAVIAFVVSACCLIQHYIIEPYKHKQGQLDTSVTDESNTNTTKNDNNDTLQAKYSALLSINPDFVGKLYIKAIDESGFNIVQSDDNSKYLYLGFKGESTRYGTLFVDYRNNIKNFDSNTIIYGHNMRDGSQLGSLSIYSKSENYKNYPVIEFNTIYKNYKWKIFSAFITSSDPSQDNGYDFPYLTTTFPSNEKFLDFVDEVKLRSYYTNPAVDINSEDKLLTLSTCDTVFDGARFVVMARMVRDGESTDVDVSQVKENDNQRFPQAWYDANEKSNPFVNSYNFTVD